jgi:hypothetical protein
VWLNRDHEFVPGQTIFESSRWFSLWAYTISHGQLLFRSRNVGGSRIDVVFKPVEALKVRRDYDGLVIRCASEDERRRVLTDLGLSDERLRVLILRCGAIRTMWSRWP